MVNKLNDILLENYKAYKTVVRHLGDDWIVINDKPIVKDGKPGLVWLNIGRVNGPPTGNTPTFIPFRDAIYNELRTDYTEPIKVNTHTTEPVKQDRNVSNVNISKNLQTPEAAYEFVADNGYAPNKTLEYIIAEDPEYAYKYVNMVLRPRQYPVSDKLENSIARDGKWAYWYATNIIKKPFPKGEPAIYNNLWYAEKYKEFLNSIKQ